MQERNHNHQAVIDLLTTLQQERFSPRGWWNFLAQSWAMSCKTANANPRLKHSWWHATLLIGSLAIVMLVATLVFEGRNAMLYLLPGFLFCVVWQQSDLFWHLGLNRQLQTGELLQRIGLANILTGLRGLCAAFLIGRLMSGLTTSSGLVLCVLLIGIVTDMLDGLVARSTSMQSKLGQIIDAEADFCLYLAITIMLIQSNLLTLWLAAVMLLRFCIPFVAALVSYFLLAQTIQFGSTIWGKYAGIAQCLYFFMLLAPPQLTFITGLVHTPLLIITLVLLIVAPLVQIGTNLLTQQTYAK